MHTEDLYALVKKQPGCQGWVSCSHLHTSWQFDTRENAIAALNALRDAGVAVKYTDTHVITLTHSV